jgi:hypothetical protein
MLKVYVASVTSAGTLVATLVDQPTLEAQRLTGTDERVGSVSIDGAGWATIEVPSLYGDSGPIWLSLSGRDGAEIFISQDSTKFAPRLSSSENSTRASASKSRSSPHVRTHDGTGHGMKSHDRRRR